MSNALLMDEVFKDHLAQYSHPENPDRLDAILKGLNLSSAKNTSESFAPRPATIEELALVHDRNYITNVLKIMGKYVSGNLDGDTFFSKGTKTASLCAAGGGIDLANAVHNRKVDWGWALVRPPGHHASIDSACGFCIFNNIAIAAASLLDKTNAERIAILDWDVHHGNGTQDQFWNNPNVLFVSMHQYPHFPGSGLSRQIGGADALGKSVNFPFPHGSQNGDFLTVIDKVVTPLFNSFQPDHILISAGFDAHRNDPLAGLEIDTECFGLMASKLKTLANSLCHGRLTLFLEGGYDLEALTDCADAVQLGLNGNLDLVDPKLEQANPTKEGQKVIESTLD